MNNSELVVLILSFGMLILAGVAAFLAWKIMHGIRLEDEKLDEVAANLKALTNTQLTGRKLAADPEFAKLMQGLMPKAGAAPLATDADEMLDMLEEDEAGVVGNSAMAMLDMLRELDATDVNQLSQWKSKNQGRLTDILKSNADMHNKIVLLQDQLQRAHMVNHKMRSREVDIQTNPALEQEVQRWKHKASHVETELTDVQKQLAVAQARFKDSEAAHAAEKKLLLEERDNLRETLNRTLVEKSFIEEVYLEKEKGPG